LRKPSQRAAWLNVERLLGEHGISLDSSAGRRQFALRMEERRAMEEKPEQKGEWKKVRRGWCLGDKKFKKELLAQMKEQRGQNHYGEEVRETDEEAAETIVMEETKKRGWDSAELASRAKGDAEKAGIALRLRQETTMTVAWIAKRLEMGTAGSLANKLRLMKGK
jgi:hypothetical protein